MNGYVRDFLASHTRKGYALTPPRPVAHFPSLVDTIAGQSILGLVRQFGTPLYVYDQSVIAQRIGELGAFDTVRYAMKACSNLAILDRVRRLGALVDTVSAGEIRRALAAGYSPHADRSKGPPPIVFTADLFDRASLDLVAQYPIVVNCGSPDMITQYGQRCPGREITLRINPGFGHGHSRKTNTGGAHSKHGIWHEQLDDCILRARSHDLKVTGLHMHIGSGTDMEHLSRVCGSMSQAARLVGPAIHSISAGGGLPVPDHDGAPRIDINAYYQLWSEVREQLTREFHHPVQLEIEPGRYLVAECGSLITEIRAIKQTGPHRFYLVDAGFNNLARPILYGAYHPMAICPTTGTPPTKTVTWQGDTRIEKTAGRQDLRDVIVGGPLCESGDIFTQREGGYVCSRPLPEAQVGDLLVIGCTGAYGAVMGSNYNSQPLAAEALLEEGQVHEIRSRQTFEALVQDESIPPHPPSANSETE